MKWTRFFVCLILAFAHEIFFRLSLVCKRHTHKPHARHTCQMTSWWASNPNSLHAYRIWAPVIQELSLSIDSTVLSIKCNFNIRMRTGPKSLHHFCALEMFLLFTRKSCVTMPDKNIKNAHKSTISSVHIPVQFGLIIVIIKSIRTEPAQLLPHMISL